MATKHEMECSQMKCKQFKDRIDGTLCLRNVFLIWMEGKDFHYYVMNTVQSHLIKQQVYRKFVPHCKFTI
jgi:hypothetical protein